MSSILDTYKSKLHPAISPEKVEFEILTIGWYVVFAILILALLITVSVFVMRWINNKYRRQAIQILFSQIKPLLHNVEQRALAFSQLSVLLKQVAVKSYANEELAGMYGGSWVEFLNSTCSKVNFSGFESFSFAESQYKTSEQLKNANPKELDQLCFMAKKWIGGHRV